MSQFKRFFTFVLAGMTALSLLAGCSQQSFSGSTSQSQPSSAAPSGSPASSSSENPASKTDAAPSESQPASASSESAPAEPETGKTLVLYFSASGNTKAVAETIATAAGSELYELTPAEPYTSDDLRWTNPDSRVNTEHNDPAHRTAIAGELPDLAAYDTIFLGYPLWWREAPSIVWNFMENADLSGKTIIPFCTSTSDGIEGSVETLRGMAPAANWMQGRRFGENLNESAVTQWVNSLELEADGSSQPAAPEGTSAEPASTGANALVVYFSVPEDVDTTGVDAIAGASVLVSNGTALGNMEYMAGIIQRETGADSYRIVEQNAYPRDHQPLIDQAQQEQRNNDRPAIAGELPDLSGYEVIYLGYPNWWGDMPMILYTFLDAVDLSGKTVVPFCVHGGSGFSGTVRTLRQLEPGAEVLDGLTISRNSIGGAEQEIVTWVNGLPVNQ